MNNKTNTIKALNELGRFLCQFTTKSIVKDASVLFNDLFFDGFKHQLKLSKEHNGWFSEANIMFSIESWAKLLTADSLNNWVSNYNLEAASQKK